MNDTTETENVQILQSNIASMKNYMRKSHFEQEEFDKIYTNMNNTFHPYYSPIAIIQTALNGFYNAYMQMYLPSTIVATLREETRKMVRALHHYNPSSCREQAINIIEYHGRGKGTHCIPNHVEELDAWIMEAILDNAKMRSQLTETITTKLNEHNAELDNSKGDQQA